MTRTTRNPERGSAMVLAMIALTGLVALGGVTVLSVKGGVAATGQERFNSVALYAAESGAAVGMDYLRVNIDPATNWTAMIAPYNTSPPVITALPGNGILPGDTGNPFTTSLQAWYEVTVLNNRDDAGFALGTDLDRRVTIRSVGHGPDGAIAIIEWSVGSSGLTSSGAVPCSSYAQLGGESGTGAAPCLGTVSSGDVRTLTPGTP